MAKVKKPRCGSLQFWPRRRSKRGYPRVRSWPGGEGLLGFCGYKVGMTHVQLKDSRSNSLTKGQSIVWPVTVVECPALKLFSVRAYKDAYMGSSVVAEVCLGVDKFASRKVCASKKKGDLAAFEKNLDSYDFLRVVVQTQPHKSGLGKKTPELFELAVGGDTAAAQFAIIQSFVGKDIAVGDVLSAHQMLDVHAVTTGRGFAGSVKRFGVSLKSHKSEKKRRAIGNLGAWTPKRVSWTVGLPGGLGYFARTEHNKEVLFVGSNPAEINPDGGFLRYGLVKSDYILIKGSVPGPAKRLIRFSLPRRSALTSKGAQLAHVSLRSKQ